MRGCCFFLPRALAPFICSLLAIASLEARVQPVKGKASVEKSPSSQGIPRGLQNKSRVIRQDLKVLGSGWFGDGLTVAAPGTWKAFSLDAEAGVLSYDFGDWEESLWFERGFMELSGGLSLGYTEEPQPGVLRWTGEDFEGFDGFEWVSLVIDPGFFHSPAYQITQKQVDTWQQAYAWGDHSGQNYLLSESDPLFRNSPAAGLTAADINRFQVAFGWGNHRLVGYLTGEADPVFQKAPASGIEAAQIQLWDRAAARGDHAAQGYLTGETDPRVAVAEVGFIPYWTGTVLEAAPLQVDGNELKVQSDTHIEGDLEVAGEVTLFRLKRQGDIFMGPFGEGSDAGPPGEGPAN